MLDVLVHQSRFSMLRYVNGFTKVTVACIKRGQRLL